MAAFKKLFPGIFSLPADLLFGPQLGASLEDIEIEVADGNVPVPYLI